jgi:hypothetical protein
MIKSIGAKIYAFWSNRKNSKWIKNPLEAQEKVLKNLIKQGASTRLEKIIVLKKLKIQDPLEN